MSGQAAAKDNTEAAPTENQLAEKGKAVEESKGKTVETPTETKPESKVEEPKVETKEESKVPEKYDLKLPEGSLLEPTRLEEISTYAKSKGFSNEQAQALLERESTAVHQFNSAQREHLTKMSEAWMAEAKADKEYGGEAFKQNAELAKRVVDKYGTESFKKALNETGLGNHPELLRIFTRIGKEMSEDKLVIAGSQSGAQKKSTEEIFYGTKQN